MGPISGALAAYLLGCVPTARIARRLTNGHPATPWIERGADFVKGFAAVYLFAPGGSVAMALIVTAVLAGEQWPATGGETGRSGHWVLLGALTALTSGTPVALGLWALGWALGFVITGYKPVGRAAAAATLPLALGFVAGWPLGGIALPGCIMILERSRDVLRRVRAGEEAKHHWNSPA